MSMKNWAPDEVRESGVKLPNDLYRVKIEHLEEKAASTGKAMIVATLRVVNHAKFTGAMHIENFTIGTDDDPTVDDPQTWTKTVGASRFKTMLKKAKVRMEANLAKQFRVAEGAELVIDTLQEVDDGSKNPKYKGNVNVRITAFYEIGERQAGSKSAPQAPQTIRRAAPPPPPPPVDEAGEEEYEEVYEEEVPEPDVPLARQARR